MLPDLNSHPPQQAKENDCQEVPIISVSLGAESSPNSKPPQVDILQGSPSLKSRPIRASKPGTSTGQGISAQSPMAPERGSSACALPSLKRHASLAAHSQGPGKLSNNLSSSLDSLPDELLLTILCFAARDAASPASHLHLTGVSRRMYKLARHPLVLTSLPLSALHVSAPNWSAAARRFLVRCSQAGNSFASYALGMIAWYCLDELALGFRLLAQSARMGCAEALFSLAIVHFSGTPQSRIGTSSTNGILGSSHEKQSGGQQIPAKLRRDPARGALLCMHAARRGHVDGLRELGHCLQDGFGVPRDVEMGRALLLRANECDGARMKSRCLSNVAPSSPRRAPEDLACGRPLLDGELSEELTGRCCDLTEANDCADNNTHEQPCTAAVGNASDGGMQSAESGPPCHCLPAVTVPLEERPEGWVHLFLIEWHRLQEQREAGGSCNEARSFAQQGVQPALGLGMNRLDVDAAVNLVSEPKGEGFCRNETCGRKELVVGEFRCCSMCNKFKYCSRVCQAQNWKMGHRETCNGMLRR